MALSAPVLHTGVFEKHVVEIVWGGTCNSQASVTNTESRSTLSIPLAAQGGASCLDGTVGFDGQLTVALPEVTPRGRLDAIRTITFDEPLGISIRLQGTLSLQRTPAGNTQRLLTDAGPSDVAPAICPVTSTSRGLPLAAGTHGIDADSQCARPSLTRPSTEGDDLVYVAHSTAAFTVSDPTFPAGFRLLYGVRVNVHSHYRVRTKPPPTDSLMVIQQSPPAGSILTNDTEVRIEATVQYALNSADSGELYLKAVDSQGRILGGLVPWRVNRTSSLQTTSLAMAPLKLSADMTNVTVRAELWANDQQVAEHERPPYPLQPDNFLSIPLNSTSPPRPILTADTDVGFSLDAEYRLGSAPNGELALDVLDHDGRLIASTGPRLIQRSNEKATRTLALSPIRLLREMDALTLRVRMSAGGTILREATTRRLVRTADEQVLRVVRVIEDAEVRIPGGDWQAPQAGMALSPGTQISTGPDSELQLLFPDGSIMTVKPMTEVLVSTLLNQGNAFTAQLHLKHGEVAAEVNPGKVVTSDWSVATPVATTSVRGTSFILNHSEIPEPTSTLTVSEGSVEFIPLNNALSPLIVRDQQTARITGSTVVPPAGPRLSVALELGNTLIVSWPAGPSPLALQSRDALGKPPDWTFASAPLATNAGRIQAIVQPGAPSKYFRLIEPR